MHHIQQVQSVGDVNDDISKGSSGPTILVLTYIGDLFIVVYINHNGRAPHDRTFDEFMQIRVLLVEEPKRLVG